MTRAVYQVRLIVKPEYEEEFNAWYEGWYIPKLMAEVPHFFSCHRYVGEFNGENIYITDYETTVEDMETAIAEMRVPERAPVNALFYEWRDKAITLHESVRFTERVAVER